MRPVRSRQVLRQRGVSEAYIRSGMGSDALPAVQDFDAAGSCPRFDFLMHKSLRHAVEVIVDGDVIIDIDARLVVASELVAADRQGSQCRPVELRVRALARSRQTLERAAVQIREQVPDGGINCGEGCELAVAQAR